MAHDLTPLERQKWQPSNGMDGLVVLSILIVCAGLIIALAGIPKPQKSDAPLEHHPAIIKDVQDDLKQTPGTPEGTIETTTPSPELFPAPASGVPLDESPASSLRSRLSSPSWGKFANAPSRGQRGRAFITLLGDRTLNAATFRSSVPGSEANFLGGIWTPKNVETSANGLTLWLKKDKEGPKYTMGEMQARGLFGYGRYEVVMRPAKGSGTVSSFFTYSGPHMGVPHDEIDIEFLGADTTKVHFNYFHLGKRGTPTIYDLPFDASDALHLYSFEWTPDHIAWFVDGVPYEKTALNDPHIPKYPGKIMFSLWTGIPKLRDWTGQPDFGASTSADYGCISFTPLGETARSCSDIFVPPAP